ncbi:MAG: hypothetical protein ACOZCO_15720 [Bacteroidota bacterium]
MKKLIYFPITLLFIACGGGDDKKKDEKSPETKTDTTSVDTVAEVVDTLYIIPDYKNPYPSSLKGDEKKLFKKYFTDSLVAETFAMRHSFDSITTEKQMRIYYDYLMAFKRRMTDYFGSDAAIDKWIDANEGKGVASQMMPEEKWDLSSDYVYKGTEELEKLDIYFDGLRVGCVAECTMLNYDLVSDELFVKAKETEGKADDDFFAFFIDYHTGEWDPETMNAKYFKATWDLGGESMLGDGSHLDYLKSIDQMLEGSKLFELQIKNYREWCISDITQWHIFALGTDKIIPEVEKIIKEVKLSAEEKKEMEKRKKEFREHKVNSETGEGLQVGCETGDCIYG